MSGHLKVLLTGCAGFIGWKTAEFLLRAGHEVVGLDNFNDYYSRRLKDWRVERLKEAAPERFNLVEGDLLDQQLLDRLLAGRGFDAVVNLAARAGVRASIEDPGIYVETNLTAATGLMQAMVRHGIHKLVLASTSAVYAGQAAPFHEDQMVDRPLSPYAASKKAVEAMAYAFHHLHGLDISILRYFTVYGPAGRPDMSPLKFTHCIARGLPFPLYGDGGQRRDFTYIDDIARGTAAALRPLGFEIINLGGGREPIPINRMIELLSQYLGATARPHKLPENPADMRETAADITKARDLLGWEPQVSPEQGFKSLADWYMAESGWLANELFAPE